MERRRRAMEMLELNGFGGVYSGRRVLVTGHTGFKGSWLCLWLKSLGAEVIGISLDPPSGPSHWDMLQLRVADRRFDVRNESEVRSVVSAERPEAVFHLAAQPIVRRSYREPVETWSTNVLGTVNLLEACRRIPEVRAVVVVTTDKCYENREWPWAYRECDRLGGHDPYSASKAGTELVVASYRAAFSGQRPAQLLATARAGNVIGGGDWSEDRLIPDLVRALVANEQLLIRSPRATRPWQHVLDSLSGYLLLGQRLLDGDGAFAEAWNFGPDGNQGRTVETVLLHLARIWPGLRYEVAADVSHHEAHYLQLDNAKARMHLGWQPVWDFERAVLHTAEWYRRWIEDGVATSAEQLAVFMSDAARLGITWART